MAMCAAGPLRAVGAENNPTLTGVVKDQAGNPVAGASVFIYTAGPREGVGVLCPSCYADCRKKTTSDAQGRFEIPGLDPTLLFRVLVVGRDYRPEFLSKVDPAAGSQQAVLKPAVGGEEPNQRMQGRVVDSEGKPVAGAVVNIRGVTRGQSTRFGGNNDVDPLAVTDDSGRFVIRSLTAFEAVGVDVEARALAKAIFPDLTTGETIHELRLNEGVSLTGRVVKDGKPLAGVEVGVAGADRRAEIYVGNYSIATGADGQFVIANLPANTDYFVYGCMSSFADPGGVERSILKRLPANAEFTAAGLMGSLTRSGSLPARRVKAEAAGSTLKVGELAVKPGFTIVGQIRLTDGQPVPAKTRIMLSREEAWDSQQAEVDPQGRFRFVGVPDEVVSISTRVKGYRLSLKNASLDTLNPFHLHGRVQGNKSDLVLEFEPGAWSGSLKGGNYGLKNEPLRGAEAAKASPGDFQVTGSVTDAATGVPLPKFTVTEGRKSDHSMEFDWFDTRKTVHTNGSFVAPLTLQKSAPALLIEAEGYFPQSSCAIGAATNLAFALKKGGDIAGKVLCPDGMPASGAKVYLTDLKNGVYLMENLKVLDQAFRGSERTTANQEGHFSFRPKIDAWSVIVLDDQGYAEVKLDALASLLEIRLQPWARVEGVLMIGATPGVNETITLGQVYVPTASEPRNFPALSFHLRAQTDAEGKFVFDRVPPLGVEVHHEPKVRDAKTGLVAVAQINRFDLQPGENRQLVVGGRGRAVIGQVRVKDYTNAVNWRADVHTLELIRPESAEVPDVRLAVENHQEAMRQVKSPAEKLALGAEFNARLRDMGARQKTFYQTQPGRDYYFGERVYALNFTKDGHFRVEDVPGGKYRLKLNLRESNGERSPFGGKPIASLQREIVVPDAPDGRSDEALDLGLLELEAAPPDQPAQIARQK